jgi:hypothetical protein
MIWYKIKRICLKKNLYCSECFYLNSNKKLLMWYKKWEKWECFNVDCYWKFEKVKKKKTKKKKKKKEEKVHLST